MGTLLLRFAAPLQSYGQEADFNVRRTRTMPTKSAVVGMLASALGRKHSDSIDDLVSLRFGARNDQPGHVTTDFQTIHSRPEETTRKKDEIAEIVYKQYIEDAVFLIGIEGEDEFLQLLSDALQHPTFHLYLGRKSCPPEQPLVLGIRKKGLQEALETEPWQARPFFKKTKQGKDIWLYIQMDTNIVGPGVQKINDKPKEFGVTKHIHEPRFMKEIKVCIQKGTTGQENEYQHNPFADL